MQHLYPGNFPPFVTFQMFEITKIGESHFPDKLTIMLKNLSCPFSAFYQGQAPLFSSTCLHIHIQSPYQFSHHLGYFLSN